MDMINESVRKVVNIISMTDGITFQTNILTLNASVDECNLVQRAPAAEIKCLIGDSEGGSKLLVQTRKIMKEIVNVRRGVTTIKSSTKAASIEQKSGIEQVNQAIPEMEMRPNRMLRW